MLGAISYPQPTAFPPLWQGPLWTQINLPIQINMNNSLHRSPTPPHPPYSGCKEKCDCIDLNEYENFCAYSRTGRWGVDRRFLSNEYEQTFLSKSGSLFTGALNSPAQAAQPYSTLVTRERLTRRDLRSKKLQAVPAERTHINNGPRVQPEIFNVVTLIPSVLPKGL